MNVIYKKFYPIFIVFLIAQPFIDVVTSINTRQTGSLLTIGTFLRFAFMLYCLGFVLIELFKTRKQNVLPIIFFVLSALAIFFSVIVNILTKHPYWFTTEMKFYAKSFYFIVLLYTGYFYTKQVEKPLRLIKYLAWINFVYGLFLILPDLIGLGFSSYRYSKGGTIGFFFSANEIGATLASLTPLSLLYALRSSFSLKTIYRWLPLTSSIVGMLLMGTKVALLAGILMILFGFLTVIVSLVKRLKVITKGSMVAFLIFGIIMLGVMPFAPAITNAKIQSTDPHLQSADDSSIDLSSINKKKLPREVKINKHVSNKYLKLLLNNRDRFFFNRYNDFQHANMSRKIFGLGYAGDYYKHPKIVEMDILDAFISYGILGSILFLSPLLYFVILSFIYFFKYFKKQQSLMTYNLLVGVIMGLGISFITGHVMFQPAASIYLVLLITLFLSRLTLNKAR